MAPFRELYARFRGLLQESWQTGEVAAHFGPMATLDTMFEYLWSRPEAQQVLLPPQGNARISRKGAAEAEKFRSEGNRLYRERKLEAALLAYSYSILAAPHPPPDEGPAAGGPYESLALGYANRSAVLYEMEQYEASIADAERAVLLGYPAAKRHRLQERRAKCLQALGRPQEAREVLQGAIDALSALSLDAEEAATSRSSLTKLQEKWEGHEAPGETAPQQFRRVFYTGPSAPPAVSSPRQDLPCVSDALRIHYTPIRGRHLVAERDIQPGEVLVVEEALTAVTKLDATLRTHCSHCLRRCPVPLPCPTCSLVVFCNEACRKSGEVGGHGAECRALAALVALQLDPAAALALRVLSSTTLDALRAQVAALRQEGGAGGRGAATRLPRGYRALYHLEGHATARSESHLQETAAVACVLTRVLLEQCPRFAGDGRASRADAALVGGQAMRLVLGLECNAHATKELVEARGGGGATAAAREGREVVGWSAYSALSLVNHSCVPNALSASLGSTKFLYSVGVIPKGAEVTDSYGERYVSHGLLERREALQRHYFFCCGCAACQADWPLFRDLPAKPAMRCPSCLQALAGFACRLCELACTAEGVARTGVRLYDAPAAQVRINRAWREYLKAAAEVADGGDAAPSPASAVAAVVGLLALLDRYTVHPNQAYVTAQETLMACFDLMGSVRLAAEKTA